MISPRFDAISRMQKEYSLATSGLGQTLLLHSLSQAERPHIGPHVFDVCQALRFYPSLSGIPPAPSILPMRWPNRVLLFMIYYHLIYSTVLVILWHLLPPLIFGCFALICSGLCCLTYL